MGNRFDDAWVVSNEALAEEMGEPISIGGLGIVAVVDSASASAKIGGMTVNSGVQFTVFLSADQAAALSPDKGAPGLQAKEVQRGAFKGRVMAVRDVGGAGVELDVGPLSSRSS